MCHWCHQYHKLKMLPKREIVVSHGVGRLWIYQWVLFSTVLTGYKSSFSSDSFGEYLAEAIMLFLSQLFSWAFSVFFLIIKNLFFYLWSESSCKLWNKNKMLIMKTDFSLPKMWPGNTIWLMRTVNISWKLYSYLGWNLICFSESG